jgi:hypothetical protein
MMRSGGSPTEAYAANNFAPQLVADFIREKYFVNAVATTFAGMIDYTGGLSTMVDSDGVLKWSPHNDVDDPTSPATQNIVVVVGAKYTVEMTGAGSVTLSGAGSGSVTAGSPVEVTATTTTLTLTVVGTVSTMWSYRSDLGGMVDNPDTGSSYVPVQGFLPRRGNHKWNGTAWVNAGLQIESAAATNLLLNTATLATQSKTVTAVAHTLHFTGTGTVTLTGASTDGPLVGTGTGEDNRVSLTFTPSAASLTLTVSGTVSAAQLEVGSVQSSYIPTAGATATRIAQTASIAGAKMPDYQTPTYIGSELVTNGTFDADTGWTKGTGWTISGGVATHTPSAGANLTQSVFTAGKVYEVSWEQTGDFVAVYVDGLSVLLSNQNNDRAYSFIFTSVAGGNLTLRAASGSVTVDNISVREINPLAVSIAVKGDSNFSGDAITSVYDWLADTDNFVTGFSAPDGTVKFRQQTAGVNDIVASAAGVFATGVNTPFNIAGRYGSTFINGAVDGVALTANTTPTSLADLSAPAFKIADIGSMNIAQLVVWPEDIEDAGVEETSA